MLVINFIKSLYLTKRVFYALAIIAVIFLFSYWFHLFYLAGWLALWALFLLVAIDAVALFRLKNGITATRDLPEKFSNSDPNIVPVSIANKYKFKVHICYR